MYEVKISIPMRWLKNAAARGIRSKPRIENLRIEDRGSRIEGRGRVASNISLDPRSSIFNPLSSILYPL